jgi:hypothetical protein
MRSRHSNARLRRLAIRTLVYVGGNIFFLCVTDWLGLSVQQEWRSPHPRYVLNFLLLESRINLLTRADT